MYDKIFKTAPHATITTTKGKSFPTDVIWSHCDSLRSLSTEIRLNISMFTSQQVKTQPIEYFSRTTLFIDFVSYINRIGDLPLKHTLVHAQAEINDVVIYENAAYHDFLESIASGENHLSRKCSPVDAHRTIWNSFAVGHSGESSWRRQMCSIMEKVRFQWQRTLKPMSWGRTHKLVNTCRDVKHTWICVVVAACTVGHQIWFSTIGSSFPN